MAYKAIRRGWVTKDGSPVPGWDFFWPGYFLTLHEAVQFADRAAFAEVWHAKMAGHFSEWRTVGKEPIAICLDGSWIIDSKESAMTAMFLNGEYLGSTDDIAAELIGDSFYDEEFGGAKAAASDDDDVADLIGDEKPARRAKKAGKNLVQAKAKAKRAAKEEPVKGKKVLVKGKAVADAIRSVRKTGGGGSGGGRKSRIPEAGIIKVLVDRSVRSGTKGALEWAVVQDGMTLATYRKVFAKKFPDHGKVNGSLPYYLREGFIQIKPTKA